MSSSEYTMYQWSVFATKDLIGSKGTLGEIAAGPYDTYVTDVGKSIYKGNTYNGFTTWNQCYSSSSSDTFKGISVSSSGGIVSVISSDSTYYAKILTSTDYGNKWSEFLTDPDNSFGRTTTSMAGMRDGKYVIFANPYISKDSGKTFNEISYPLSGNLSVFTGKAWYSATDYFGIVNYLAYSDDLNNLDEGSETIYEIPTDYTNNYAEYTGLGAPYTLWSSITANAPILVASERDGYIHKYKGNKTWEICSPPKAQWLKIASSSDGKYVAAINTNPGLWISADYGQTWYLDTLSKGYQFKYISFIRTEPTDINGVNYSIYAIANDAVYKGKLYTTSQYTTFGSEENTFTNGDIIVEKFTTIPGPLITKILEDGDYSDPSIRNIFERLSKYSYPESIFDIIKYNLAAFFPSIAYAQAYTTIVEELTAKYNNGEITIEQYNIALEVSAEKLAENYPTWYFNSLTKIEAAMIKYKYILLVDN
jgi:hypothetical protein